MKIDDWGLEIVDWRGAHPEAPSTVVPPYGAGRSEIGGLGN